MSTAQERLGEKIGTLAKRLGISFREAADVLSDAEEPDIPDATRGRSPGPNSEPSPEEEETES